MNRRYILSALAALVLAVAANAKPQGHGGGGPGGGGPGGACGGGGIVASVDATSGSFVVQTPAQGGTTTSVTVSTTDTTQYQFSDGTSVTFADITVGAHVCVQGTATDATDVTATTVVIMKENDGDGRPVGGGGTVSSVDATNGTFVVTAPAPGGTTVDVTVTTSASTTYQKSDGTAGSFADIVVGAEVCVQGNVTGTNALAATEVTIKAAASTSGSTKGKGKGKGKGKH